ncbi:MAG: type II toxin-antitoxin system HicB family antitoxin [Candidatus Binatia bacterium]
MRNEFAAIIEQDGEWYVAYCPEIPGANGQGRTKEEARKSLANAITLILEDRRQDVIRSLSVRMPTLPPITNSKRKARSRSRS